MKLFRPTYTKPLPAGAKVFCSAKGPGIVRYTDRRGRRAETRLSKSGDKMLVETADWHIRFKDQFGIMRRMRGFTDRQATQRLADNVQQLLWCCCNNQPVGGDLRKWVERAPKHVRADLVAFKLLDERILSGSKPLSTLIELYQATLDARERKRSHVTKTANDLRTICEDCGWSFFSDIEANALERYLKLRRQGKVPHRRHGRCKNGISYRRSNAMLTAMKGFCNWLIQAQYVTASPVACLRPLNVKRDRRRVRRALELDELRRLLTVTVESGERYGFSGYERTLIYRMAAETGLRASELASLTVRSFHWDSLTVEIQAQDEKKGEGSFQPLRPETAAEMQHYLSNKLPGAKVFEGLTSDHTADMMREDLEAAGIDYIDAGGQVFDFHALRGQYGTLLAHAGVHPKTAQKLMRHSDINLTMNLYTHTLRGQEADAVNSLPDLSVGAGQVVMTGTDAAPDQTEACQNLVFQTGADGMHTDGNDNKAPFLASEQPIAGDKEGIFLTHNPLVAGSNPAGPSLEVTKA